MRWHPSTVAHIGTAYPPQPRTTVGIMNSFVVALIAASESAGVGLIGVAVLRFLRKYSLGVSVIAVVAITVCATNLSVITITLGVNAEHLSLGVGLITSGAAGVVSVLVGLGLSRQLYRGSQQLAEAARGFGSSQKFELPHNPPSAEFASLAEELRQTSNKLVESRQREQAVEAARRHLVAWISHDLRSPLVRMKAAAESIEDGVTTDLPRFTTQIRSDVDQLTEMVDDLFDLSRIQSGTLRLNPQTLAIGDLISDTVASLELLAEKHGIALTASHIEPVYVHVDERLMSRVFTNILSNAIHYSPADTSVAISVATTQGWAVVAMADQCGGIPPEDLRSVFEMGWRGDQAHSTGKNQGGGLGLAIVQGVVDAHRGKVSVDNVTGGCCFRIWLPAASRPQPATNGPRCA
jgi:signal transduction histidine kinase